MEKLIKFSYICLNLNKMNIKDIEDLIDSKLVPIKKTIEEIKSELENTDSKISNIENSLNEIDNQIYRIEKTLDRF